MQTSFQGNLLLRASKPVLQLALWSTLLVSCLFLWSFGQVRVGHGVTRDWEASTYTHVLAGEWAIAQARGSDMPSSLERFIRRYPRLLDRLGPQCLDPWGMPYTLRPSARDPMEVVSGGPDRVLGTDDDVRAPIPVK
ncbi:MAG: hypothetical protein KDE27_12990 [Planctomycetes bacterium]|nr:hypothetical protein [Planctomycetota bacterium]